MYEIIPKDQALLGSPPLWVLRFGATTLPGVSHPRNCFREFSEYPLFFRGKAKGLTLIPPFCSYLAVLAMVGGGFLWWAL